jgi:sulfide:quinone oxidoreductase
VGTRREPVSVVIAGSGFAALETALALRALAEDHVRLTFVSPEAVVRYRPAATSELFDGRPPRTYDLCTIADQLNASIHLARLESAAPQARQVRLSSGARLSYDALVLAIGSRARASIPGARTFRDQRDVPAFRALLTDVEAGRIAELVFAVPSGSSWPLPLYELALLAGEHAQQIGAELDIAVVSPEPQPLSVFGATGSRGVARLLEQQGIRFVGSSAPTSVRRDGALELAAGGALPADQVVTIPQLGAHRIVGIPASWWGFVPTDSYGRVEGLDDVYAAGDVTAFPVKQGGIAAQQADRIAHTIASRLGLPVKELDTRLILQAHLIGGPETLFLRTELDWQGRATDAVASHRERGAATARQKVLGRYLAPYLEQLDRPAA